MGVLRALQLRRALLWQFVKRMLVEEFRGSLLGLGWLIVRPLSMLAVYVFVFHGIFKAKWPGVASFSGWEYGLFVFVGLIAFQFLAETAGRGVSLIVSQPNLVSKVVFPLEILPTALTLSQLAILMINFALLSIVLLIWGRVSWLWIWVPVLLFPLVLLGWGGAFILSALGVYLRDMAQVVTMVLTALMFLSPVFYPISAIPETWRFWYELNPLTGVIESLRHVLLLGQSPDWIQWCISFGMSAGIWLLGAWVFLRLKRGFADVL
jgi:lipopolysaccharide transport system permease protein